MTRRSIFFLVALVCAAVAASLVAPFAFGQAVAVAEIQGQVLDPSGSAIPGATVKAVQTDTQFTRTTTAGADGGYVLPNLPLGPYRLQDNRQGFQTYWPTGH